MNWIKTIRGKLLFSIFIVHSLLMGLIVYDLIDRQYLFLDQQLSKNGHSLATSLASNAAMPLQNNDLSALENLITDLHQLSDVSMIFLMDGTGRIRASYPKEYLNQTLTDNHSISMIANVDRSHTKIHQSHHENTVDTIKIIEIAGHKIGYCRVLQSKKTILDELKTLTQSGILYILFAIFTGMLIAWLVIRKMTERLSNLAKAADQLAKQHYDISIPNHRSDDEIASMERGFNVMVDSIKAHIHHLSQIGANRLLQSQRYQNAILEWSRLDYEDSAEALRKSAEIAADTLEISRVGIWRMTPDESMIICETLYCRDRNEHMEGMILHRHDYPLYFAELHKGELIVADDAQNDPVTSEFKESYLKPIGIRSMLDIPIIQEGKVIGVVCHEQRGVIKQWQPEEQDFAMAMASTVALAYEMQHRKNIEERLEYRAYHDELTDLPNRRLFLDRLEHSIRHAERYNQIVAILFIDLDHFKDINDSLGHVVGDNVLIHVARLISAQLRNVDTFARLGGDEFCLIIDTLDDIRYVSTVAEKLIELLQQPICTEKHELYVTSSIGISMYPSDGTTAEELLRNADSAMYKAKQEGRNNYNFYTEDMTARAYERVALESSLRKALEHHEFYVCYQPQFDGMSGKLIGTEALIRWEHPEQEMIPPYKFLPLAIETGLIIAIDRYVMRTAMQQFKKWYDEGFNPGILALNLTIKQLIQEDFISVVTEMIKETGCQNHWIEFEVTEGEIMKNPDQAIETLRQIHALGIKLAIDDFGTGYSSLAYLKRLPIDKIKIDRSFVTDLPEDEEDTAIVRAIIALSQALRLEVIAEGVETLEQKRFLVANGCSHIQGYFYSKPIRADEMKIILQECLITRT